MSLLFSRKNIMDIGCDAEIRPVAMPEDSGEALVSCERRPGERPVIHTAVPVWRDGESGETEILRTGYLGTLGLAEQMGFETVAIPLLGSGENGFPDSIATDVAVRTIGEFLVDHALDIVLSSPDPSGICPDERLAAEVAMTLKLRLQEEQPKIKAPSLRRPIICDTDVSPNREQTPNRADMPSGRFKFLGRQVHSESREETEIDRLIRRMDEPFAVKLGKLIDAKNMDDVTCYKKANVSKQTWHQILNKENYRPSKNTVLSFAIALELSLAETKSLLETAGLALSTSDKFDVIIRYFLEKRFYDVYKINEILLDYDLPLLGSKA